MEVLIFIALAIIFFTVLNIGSKQRNNTDDIRKDMTVLSRQLVNLKEQLDRLSTPSANINELEQQRKEKEAAELKTQEAEKIRLAAIEALRIQREEKAKLEEQKRSENIPAPLYY